MPSAPHTLARSHRRWTLLAVGGAAAALGAVAFLHHRTAAPRTTATTSSALLSARLDSSHILRGTSETYLAVSLAAPDGRVSTRPPTSVAIVLDRSGSMLGKSLDDAKAAAEALVDKLGPDDELALVTYSTGAELVMPLQHASADARAHARAELERLVAEGGTNISGGLNLGADELVHAHTALRRMVLISDGQANEGVRQRPALIDIAGRRAAEGLSITSVGVGLDFDEATMAGIAVAGHGNYHFVEHTEDLGAMFVSELGSLGETVVTHAALRIEPADGVEVLDVIGYDLNRDGRAVIVPIADLRRGEHTKVVLRIRATTGSESVKELATVRWTFDQIGAGHRSEIATARAEVTNDATVVAHHLDRDTVRLVEQAKTARALDDASAAYGDGRYDEAQAILRVRAAEAAGQASALGDDGLRQQIQNATSAASHGFAAAPAPSAVEGRRAAKGARADAYELAR